MKSNIINLTNPLITKSEKVHIQSSSDILNVLEQIEPYYKDYGLTTDDYKIIRHFEKFDGEKKLIE